jgi:Fe(3+) dicitrate transport protein
VDTLGLIDEVQGGDGQSDLGALRLYANASFLNAEFTSGPVDGKTPQYAPDYLLRTGVIYDYQSVAKLALLSTFVDAHYADDGNTENRYIPSYKVWDLTAEVPVIPNVLSVVAGVNNLFDENYYARVRSNGIDPALPRNAYGGVNVRF